MKGGEKEEEDEIKTLDSLRVNIYFDTLNATRGRTHNDDGEYEKSFQQKKRRQRDCGCGSGTHSFDRNAKHLELSCHSFVEIT